MRRTLDH